jgi:hypothetical protein
MEAMEVVQPSGMLPLLVLVAGSLLLLVYSFLRMAGVVPRARRGQGRPPPATPLG